MRSLIQVIIGIIGLLLLSISPVVAQGNAGGATSQTDTDRTHLIKPGETLTSIARSYGVEVAEIRDLNGLKGSLIYAGRTLKIPEANPGSIQRSGGVLGSLPPGAYAHRSAAEDVWSRTNLEVLFGEDTSTIPLGEPSNLARRGDPVPASRGWSQRQQTRGADSTTYVRLGQGQGQRIVHQVSRDEDINDIAEQYGVSVDQIRSWNQIADVYTGQKINIYQKIGIRRRTGPQTSLTDVRQNLLGQEEEPEPVTTGTQLGNTGQRNPGGTRTESGRYEALDLGKKDVFYLAHKSLPVGSNVNLSVPGNGGFITLKVIGRLQQDSEVDYILSPAAARLIESAGAKGTATLLLN